MFRHGDRTPYVSYGGHRYDEGFAQLTEVGIFPKKSISKNNLCIFHNSSAWKAAMYRIGEILAQKIWNSSWKAPFFKRRFLPKWAFEIKATQTILIDLIELQVPTQIELERGITATFLKILKLIIHTKMLKISSFVWLWGWNLASNL